MIIEFESTKFRKSVCDIHMELILVNTALNRQVVHALVLMNRRALLSRSIQNRTGIAQSFIIYAKTNFLVDLLTPNNAKSRDF